MAILRNSHAGDAKLCVFQTMTSSLKLKSQDKIKRKVCTFSLHKCEKKLGNYI